MSLSFVLCRLLLLSLYVSPGSSQSVSVVPQEYIKPADCPSNDFFSPGNLSCVSCEQNSVQEQPVGASCVCSPGHVRNIATQQCILCSNNQVVSRDGLFCLTCQAPLMFNQDTLSCTGCNSTSYLIDSLPSSQGIAGTRMCVSCPQGMWAGPDQSSCIPCGVADCTTCSTNNVFGGVCFSSQLSSPMQQFTFYNVHYSAAVQLCQNGNATACQLVLNLCVLQLYNREDPACVQSMALSSTQPSLVPLIYYTQFGADEYLENTIIQSQLTSRGSADSSRLQLLAVQFSLNGTFISLINITDEIMLCSEHESRATSAWQIGTQYELQCNVNSQTLTDSGNTPVFIDLFLRDGDRIVPVPILPENYRDTAGNAVNEGNDVSRWQFVRRLYLTQSVTNTPMYADKMDIRLVLRSGGRVQPPYIRVHYEPIPTSQDTTPASFAVIYEQPGNDFNIGLSVVAVVLLAVVGVYAGFKTNGFMRRNGSTFCELPTLLFSLVETGATFSTGLFILLVCAGCFWFVFFKAQLVLFIALPLATQEIAFIFLLVLAFVLRLAQVIYLMWRQLSVDIFLIDWEKPQGLPAPADSASNGGLQESVSIWRTYFIANEWNEIQSLRKISPTLLLLAVLFFLEVVGLKNLAERSIVAYVTADNDRYLPSHSPVLRFVLAAVLFLVLGVAMRLYMVLIHERFIEHKVRQFIDLCSVSNVSLLLMSHNLFGYYIHGRSVHGKADVDMRQMNHNLMKEQEDMCGQRGLLADSDEQVYEVAVSRAFRERYNAILQPILAERAEVQPVGRQGGRTTATGSPVTEVTLQVHEEMDLFLSSFLDHNLSGCDYVPKTKLLLEKILGMEFYDPVDRSLFYADPGYSFTEVLFYGHEWSLFSLEVLLFAVVDLPAQNYVLAAAVTYVVTQVLSLIRDGLGKRNLGRKTLVDDRFLI